MANKLLDLYKRQRDFFRRKLGLFLFDRVSLEDKSISARKINRILIIRWDAKLGDSIVSSFLSREIKKIDHNIQINILSSQALAHLYKSYWHASEVFISPKRPSYFHLAQLANKMGDIDLVIHLTKQMKMKDLFFIRKLNAKWVASLDDEPKLVNIKLGKLTKGCHFSEKYKRILDFMGSENVDKSYIIPLEESSRKRLSRFLIDNNIHGSIIAINPFGAGKRRRLNDNSIKRIVSIIKASQPTCSILIIAPPTLSNKLSDIIKIDQVLTYPSTSLFDLFEQVNIADKLISVDTATVHIASGLNKPVFSIYNSDRENYFDWSPNNNDAVTVFSKAVEPADINNLDWDETELKLINFLLHEKVTHQ